MKLLVLMAVFAAAVLVGCTDERVAILESQVVDLSKERDAAIAQADELKTEVQSLKEGLDEVLAELRKPTPKPTSTPRPRATPTPAIPEGLWAWLDWYEGFYDLNNEDIQSLNALLEKVSASGKQPAEFLDEFRELMNSFRDGAYVLATRAMPRSQEARPIISSIRKYVETNLSQYRVIIRYLETGDRALWEQADALRIESNVLLDEFRWAVDDLKAKYGID